jgi:hypothetical protein
MAVRDGRAMLAALHASCSEGFIELWLIPRIRWAGADPKEYFRLSEREEAVRYAYEKRGDFQVYFGVAPRCEPPWYAEGCRHGGDRVEQVPAVWADIDTMESVAEVVTWALRPSVVVQSGTPGHLHAYWVLEDPVEPGIAHEINESLARHLGTDPRVADPGWCMPLPGALNRKREPYQEVRLADCSSRRYHVETLRRSALPVTHAVEVPAGKHK